MRRALIAALLWGCGSQIVLPSAPVSDSAVVYEGDVSFEARAPTPKGASSAVETRPARFVRVEFRNHAGKTVHSMFTDERGHFRAELADKMDSLVVSSVAKDGQLDFQVCSDAQGRLPHQRMLSLRNVRNDALQLNFSAAEQNDAGGFSGALHILDTLLRGGRAVRRWTGVSLPPFFAYWGRGATKAWSYYRGEVPTGSNRYSVEVLSGDPSRPNVSDTDEHDEAIILHEFGHFVMDVLSTDSSGGGHHPSGHLIEPGLAWEEGRASWFAVSVLGSPNYQDTIGIEPHGSLRVNENCERRGAGPRGAGSEQGVCEVLWDLSDGGELPDTDGDGLALGPDVVMKGMIALRKVEGAYPTIETFLKFLIASTDVTQEQVVSVLAKGRHPLPTTMPLDVPSIWPVDIELSGSVHGKIDGVSSPAPSGGPARPQNGFDAMRAYRVHTTKPGVLVGRLKIFGTGEPKDHEDLDLELRSIRADLLGSGRTSKPIESITEVVEPGWYVFLVRDGGGGNRVSFELKVRFEPK